MAYKQKYSVFKKREKKCRRPREQPLGAGKPGRGNRPAQQKEELVGVQEGKGKRVPGDGPVLVPREHLRGGSPARGFQNFAGSGLEWR